MRLLVSGRTGCQTTRLCKTVKFWIAVVISCPRQAALYPLCSLSSNFLAHAKVVRYDITSTRRDMDVQITRRNVAENHQFFRDILSHPRGAISARRRFSRRFDGSTITLGFLVRSKAEKTSVCWWPSTPPEAPRGGLVHRAMDARQRRAIWTPESPGRSNNSFHSKNRSPNARHWPSSRSLADVELVEFRVTKTEKEWHHRPTRHGGRPHPSQRITPR